jgi:hypothetical protein
MKYQFTALAMACAPMGTFAFVTPLSNAFGVSSSSTLSMVLEKPRTAKKLAKIEVLKTNSNHLIHPLKDVSCLTKSEENVCCRCPVPARLMIHETQERKTDGLLLFKFRNGGSS